MIYSSQTNNSILDLDLDNLDDLLKEVEQASIKTNTKKDGGKKGKGKLSRV